MTEKLPRRGVLQSVGALGIGIGGGMGSPQQLAEALDAVLDATNGSRERHDPHTLATFAALVDAVVPRTPELAEDVHTPGGLAVDLHVGTIEFIDGFVSPEGAVPRFASTDGHTAPLSESVAVVLDAAADQLVARGDNRDELKRRGFGGGSTFAMLSRCDRFRALAAVEAQGGPYGGFVVALAVAFPALLYYSDWAGYDAFSKPPSERSFDATDEDGDYFPGWAQAGYEGPGMGAAVLRGYEVDEFEETYETDEESASGPEKSAPPRRGENL